MVQNHRNRVARAALCRLPQRRLGRWLTVCVSLMLSTGVSFAVLAGTAEAAGTGVSITFTSLPSPITADGSSQTTATVQVTDADSAGVAGDTVTFSSPDDPDIAFSNPATDNGDGTYTITITSSTHAGTPTIRATDNTGGNDLTADTTLTQTPGQAANVTLNLVPASIHADGTSTSTATANVTDAHDNPVPGESVSFSSSDAGDQFSVTPAITDASGNATTTITSSTTVGAPTITATDGTLSDQKTLTQTVGPASSISLQLSPTSIIADGTHTSTATATVQDAQGHPLPNETVGFSSNGGNAVGATTNHHDGTYTATITSTTTVGTPTITATDGALSDHKTLTQTVGPASSISLQLSSTSIIADGAHTTTATATVKDAEGHLLPNETVGFSSDGGNAFGATTNHRNGTYTASITSTTTVGAPTITATDGTLTDHKTLTQTVGPAASVTVQLAPTSIVANGVSTSTATATVTDSVGHLLPNETVAFTSTHSGDTVTTNPPGGDGTYSATIRSSVTPGQATIKARDTATNAFGTATLLEEPSASTTSLVASPSNPFTNQAVTLFAAVTQTSAGTVSGSITFEQRGTPISAACTNEPVSPSNQTATCQTSFSAATSPEQLTAIFTPDLNATVAGSTSATNVLSILRDLTSTTLTTSNPSIGVGGTTTYTAAVSPSNSGPLRPSGSVAFLDAGTPIASCAHQPLNGALTATCTVGYGTAGTHSISAQYSGDFNFGGSGSSPATETVNAPPPPPPPQILGTIHSTMQWTFQFTRSYTKIVSLVVNGVPIGATVVINCHGRGCPFVKQTTHVTKGKRCGSKCGSKRPGTLDIAQRFRQRHLHVGARIVIEILRPNWIGKYYRFTIRAQHGPRILISCLSPGRGQPGVGC